MCHLILFAIFDMPTGNIADSWKWPIESHRDQQNTYFTCYCSVNKIIIFVPQSFGEATSGNYSMFSKNVGAVF